MGSCDRPSLFRGPCCAPHASSGQFRRALQSLCLASSREACDCTGLSDLSSDHGRAALFLFVEIRARASCRPHQFHGFRLQDNLQHSPTRFSKVDPVATVDGSVYERNYIERPKVVR